MSEQPVKPKDKPATARTLAAKLRRNIDSSVDIATSMQLRGRARLHSSPIKPTGKRISCKRQMRRICVHRDEGRGLPDVSYGRIIPALMHTRAAENLGQTTLNVLTEFGDSCNLVCKTFCCIERGSLRCKNIL